MLDHVTRALSERSTLATAMAVGSARQRCSIGRRADLAVAAAKAINSDTANIAYIDSVLWLVERVSHDVRYFYCNAKQTRED